MWRIVGLLLGDIGARALTDLFGWPMLISLAAVCIAVGFAAGVGLIFGCYPARHASALDPIDALRAE